MRDPHLEQVRGVYARRLRGQPWKAIAEAFDISVPTARKRYDEYWERRADGTLHTDIDAANGQDLYDTPSIPRKTA